LPGETATPVAIVAREVLQNAHDLDEALAIVRKARVFVSTLWLVGSRADGKFVVIEKTPDATNVRQATDDWIVCANHFETEGMSASARNQTYQREATSLSRESRMLELLKNDRGAIDPVRAAAFLRDRDLPGGGFPGNGHRATLNALIATHATIMDLTDGIFWAASPPNQLGKFVAFDTRDFDHELPALTIPADPMLASGEYNRARRSQQDLADGRRALKARDAATALKDADDAETLNPGFYQNAALRGRALEALGRNADAARAFAAALAEHPAFLKENKDLESLLGKSASSSGTR
jgi:hypothetical protein